MKEVWKVGETVKVVAVGDVGNVKKEMVPIGQICRIEEVCHEDDGSVYYGILPANGRETYPFYYTPEQLEKGHLEWVRD